MKLISWNVNGIRAVAKKGFLEWLSYESPDIFCAQEVKAELNDVDEILRSPFGYKTFWRSAEKKGYSGVAVYSKHEPLSVKEGLGHPEFDQEGRTLVLEFPKFTLINAYFPNSQREHARLPYKIKFCDTMLEYCQDLRKQKKNVVICGDFNIAHKEIDLRNPKTNQDNAGFLPQERAWMDRFVQTGYVDTFRHFNQEPDHYTWWSYRPGVREKNIGWRLDYFFVNQEIKGALNEALIHPNVEGSDHCPVSLTLKF